MAPIDDHAPGPEIHLTSADSLHSAARQIFSGCLEACTIADAFDRHLHFEGNTLVHHPFPALQHVVKPVHIALDAFRHIRIVALGKAAWPMLDALLSRLPSGLPYRAICASPERPPRRHWRIQAYESGHPFPNEESFEAARQALRMMHQAHADTFVFFLVSGGGSSSLELPLDESISLQDTIAFHEALVGCGATIAEINVVRKHFSAVKGGRLALAAPEATKLTLQVADVPLRNLDCLASGPTIPDRSTIQECREILEQYALLERFPEPVRRFFSAEDIQETPGAKPNVGSGWLHLHRAASATAVLRSFLRPNVTPAFAKDPAGFGALSLDTLLSSHDLANAARDRAQQLGLKVVIDNGCDDWSYHDAAIYLLRRLRELRIKHPRLCLISTGEVTVRLGQNPGTGGRNQQFVLAAALALAGEMDGLDNAGDDAEKRQVLREEFHRDFHGSTVCIFSAGTDGVDGNSPVAGAIADRSTTARARALHFDPAFALKTFDACPLFSALGDTVVTGKTGHNLRDLRLLLCMPEENLPSLPDESPAPLSSPPR